MQESSYFCICFHMKNWISLMLSLLLSALLYAQDDQSLYMEQAGASALLYRGHKAFGYPMAYNGTCYWDGPAFLPGEVTYNGKHYDALLLNIDASRQDLLVRTAAGTADKVLSRELVTRFSMDGRPFLNLQAVYGPGCPQGYWEVIYDGRAKVACQVRRSLRPDLDGNLRTQMGYDQSSYRSNVYQTFIYEAVYCYVGEDGTVTPLRGRSQLLRLYKDHRREIRRHISRLEGDGRIDFAAFCKEVVRYAESL